MKDFSNINFKWTFREYQKRVLDNSQKYLKDKKINIVAAPGSGKTILGLELITRLKAPCIIFSPTITIRDQWQDRFQEAFLGEDENISDYFSTDLNKIKLMNSITYQALHSVMNKVEVEDDEEKVNYSELDLFQVINKHKITTICLDEAHHLQNEWQKALEKFIKKIDKNITVISLTATPPYDASREEWNRYISICGEIDEEIQVPELVKYNTLCPHQDYVYFNYPIEEEINDFKEYKIKAHNVINGLRENEIFIKFYNLINSNKFDDAKIYKDIKSFTCLISLFLYLKLEVNNKVLNKADSIILQQEFTLETAQTGIDYLLANGELNEEDEEKLLEIFKKNSLVDRGKIELSLSEKLKKKLASSIGKLDSIQEIVDVEYGKLKDNLRMLILTDYIKKESIGCIGKDGLLNNISIVTIFEKIRRKKLGVKIGALSGGLVILPSNLEHILYEEYGVEKDSIVFKQINDSEYSNCTMKGSNKDKVNLIGKLFKDGHLQVLVGTKSLLGEGWDSPCINSLILASFVGSFMLSNQMRGRAIRIFKEDPNKVANIWHLVAIEPSYLLDDGNTINNEKVIVSSDYETLVRRFNCFVGPNYEENTVESGIERLTCIKGPYNKEGVGIINDSMKSMALDRHKLKDIWISALDKDTKLTLVNVIDKRKRVPLYIPLKELLKVTSLYLVYILALLNINRYVNYWYYDVLTFIMMMLFVVILPFTYKKLYIYFRHMTSRASIKTLSNMVLNALKLNGLVTQSCQLNIKKAKNTYEVTLLNASYHEENVFNKSLKELLCLNENPRYLIIAKTIFNRKNYNISYALPSLLANRKENTASISKLMHKSLAKNILIYTKNKEEDILKYIKHSYVIRSNEVISKQKVE